VTPSDNRQQKKLKKPEMGVNNLTIFRINKFFSDYGGRGGEGGKIMVNVGK
jgi:hypothetical protein